MPVVAIHDERCRKKVAPILYTTPAWSTPAQCRSECAPAYTGASPSLFRSAGRDRAACPLRNSRLGDEPFAILCLSAHHPTLRSSPAPPPPSRFTIAAELPQSIVKRLGALISDRRLRGSHRRVRKVLRR